MIDAPSQGVHNLALSDGIAYAGGELFLPGLGLWLDSRKARAHAFVSHAHSDHIAAHTRTILSRSTDRFFRHRTSSRRETVPLKFHEEHRIGVNTVRLLPAGHVLGSAQVLVTHDDGRTLVYTGDFKLRARVCSEACEVTHADVVIMESTFGEPRWRFPVPEEVADQLVQSVRRVIDAKKTPVVLAYPLGKSQEALHILTTAGLPVAIHKTIRAYVELYEAEGVRFGPYEHMESCDTSGHVLLMSAGAQRTSQVQSLPHVHTIFLSGWGLDARARYRYGVDEMIPMSDHADFGELLEYVERCAPRRVYTVHGSAEFARILRSRGVEAYHLPDHQPSLFDQ
jgi:Cft2 family RNA processing exonuclease